MSDERVTLLVEIELRPGALPRQARVAVYEALVRDNAPEGVKHTGRLVSVRVVPQGVQA